jgi:hypothetical protein
MKCPNCGEALKFQPAQEKNYRVIRSHHIVDSRVRECYCEKCMTGFFSSEKVVSPPETKEIILEIEKQKKKKR